MRLKNGFACILSALMICAAVGCGRRTDSGDKSEVKGGEHVKKFIARKPEKEVISLRISSDILKTIDNKSTEIGISRNELINQMIQYSLDNMDDTSDES